MTSTPKQTPMTTKQLQEMHQEHVAAEETEFRSLLARQKKEIAHQHAERDRILNHTRRATDQDYGRWLALFLTDGGCPTHWYDYPMPENFRVVLSRFELSPLYGASALSLIVPSGCRLTGICGHTDLFRMDEPGLSTFVPIYSNTVIMPEATTYG
jgi:hypothetical protein